ncbi:Eco57I restriction-modification methylase domain-containing protein [Candidatus Bipolaricaulota sp. J31]
MNRQERAKIRQMVLACRKVLEQELDELLRMHGLLPERVVSVPGDRGEVQARLEEAIHREAKEYPAARERYIRNAAFTLLNRLICLRMAEEHGLITETVVARPEYGGRSKRERDLADEEPELAANPEKLSQEALRRAFGEMRAHIPLLFRPDDPYGLLLPRLPAYRQVREEFERLPRGLWRKFETLGWAYQFFNSEERKAIRQRLRRNPRPDDIPPLNQFYTVGWIVKALVQNTLGKLWLEAHPSSPLRERLDYLVPCDNSFRPPERSLSAADLKVLDPACGSGHFLLHAFDLLLEMWKEDRPDLPAWAIPALILEHNLYGVDIDLRACQIAAIALYLKARTAFERLKGSDPDARFEPKRINIVCADIRFTDQGKRERFLRRFSGDPGLYAIVLRTLEECEKAFQIGSLLRIRKPFEELFRSRAPKGRVEQLSLLKRPTLAEVLEGISSFIREATEAQDMGSRLFGMDAERAVQLVDVLTDRYDVVLMNPPYGAMPPECKEYARQHYPRTHNNYYTAFIEQAIKLTKPGGYVGAITGSSFLFLKSFQKLREEILRADALPEIVWDLGLNVLDEAMERYAAFVLRKRWDGDGVDWQGHPVTFFRLTEWDWDDKGEKFEQALRSMLEGRA